MISTNKIVEKNILNYTLYDEITIENRLFVSWETFEKAIQELHNKLNIFENRKVKNNKDRKTRKIENIYAIPRGGLCLGVKLSHITGLPLINQIDKISDTTLIVDDCTDTGNTIAKLMTLIKHSHNAKPVTMTMFHKPSACFKPDIYFMETDKQINFCWESKDQRN